MTIKTLFKMLVLLVTFAIFTKKDVTCASIESTTQVYSSAPCPCDGQPAGTVISHPSNCRAYYTCLGGANVLHSRCVKQAEFFHPYTRSCVDRSTLGSFVPDFIPTKDICKITAVFPAPAMEDMDSCIIKEDNLVSNDTNSDEIFSRMNPNVEMPTSTAIPGLDKIFNLFPWMSNQNRKPGQVFAVPTEIPYQVTTQNQSPFLRNTGSPTTVGTCKLARVVIQHFPGPCRADITCENGAKLSIDKCQSSLSLVQI